MSLISVFDTEIVEGKKIKPTTFTKFAMRELKKEGKIFESENQDTVNIEDFILKMYEITNKVNKYSGNKNASK